MIHYEIYTVKLPINILSFYRLARFGLNFTFEKGGHFMACRLKNCHMVSLALNIFVVLPI